MIDEKKLIDELKQSGMIADNEYGNAIIDMINSQSKIGELILCEERLPENFQDVLVLYKARIDGGTHDGEEGHGFGIGYYYNKKWTFKTILRIKTYSQEVIAWMPLPEMPEKYKE